MQMKHFTNTQDISRYTSTGVERVKGGYLILLIFLVLRAKVGMTMKQYKNSKPNTPPSRITEPIPPVENPLRSEKLFSRSPTVVRNTKTQRTWIPRKAESPRTVCGRTSWWRRIKRKVQDERKDQQKFTPILTRSIKSEAMPV